MKIKIRWQADDGYVGGNRPQHTSFNTEDVMDDEEWDALPEDEKKKHIEDAVEEDFRNKVSFTIDDYGI